MDRVVALKVISASAMKDEAAAKRFQREVKAAARLEHPNIITAHDSRFDHGTHYLVMQYVEGATWGTWSSNKVRCRSTWPLHCVLQAARGWATPT